MKTFVKNRKSFQFRTQTEKPLPHMKNLTKSQHAEKLKLKTFAKNGKSFQFDLRSKSDQKTAHFFAAIRALCPKLRGACLDRTGR